ncbi:L-histidine N(alpha)-methyltransferase [Sunxiuqinia indica]|uniref:L-histidine N(alpha)-methyltransferase n=1 Tax=Sunxiuqinia indica TaxID=2692584 RepID=UPI00135742A4|nr:L-histidine N(alpha)-methyltransferase [Sunxiuqinia indica]
MEQQTLISEIGTDTLNGLSASPKYLLSKYFYDDQGSSIFQDIMQMPEYYLTDCEFEIFSTHRKQITNAFKDGVQGFDLIELGSGDGLKTKVLLQFLMESSVSFRYIPIDISHKANVELVNSLKKELPLLNVSAQTGDYFQEVKKLNGHSGLRKVILFLGSNIGNFSEEEIDLFFSQLSGLCHQGDRVLIGFDLKKSPDVIMNAYNDSHGHTEKFNLNHLLRLNKELNANFNPANFEHHTEYNPETGKVKSYLVSKTKQTVSVGDLDTDFHFNPWETIFMELSQKFDYQGIETLAQNHGFKVVENFTDNRNYFVDSLWQKI